MKRRVKFGQTLLLLHWDRWLCYLQGLPTPEAAATPQGLLARGGTRTGPVFQGTGWAKTGTGPMVVSLIFTACYPVWLCYWMPGRLEWGQSFRGWFLGQTTTRDGPNTAKMLSLQIMGDIHVRLRQTSRPQLDVPSVCHLSTSIHVQHGPEESTLVQVGHVGNFGSLFKLGLLLKSVVIQDSNHITALLRTILKVEALFFLKYRDTHVCFSLTKKYTSVWEATL